MHQPNEIFLNHAAECKRTAKSSRDRGSRATWMQMAERWHRLAEMEMSAHLAAVHHSSKRHRKPTHVWSNR